MVCSMTIFNTKIEFAIRTDTHEIPNYYITVEYLLIIIENILFHSVRWTPAVLDNFHSNVWLLQLLSGLDHKLFWDLKWFIRFTGWKHLNCLQRKKERNDDLNLLTIRTQCKSNFILNFIFIFVPFLKLKLSYMFKKTIPLLFFSSKKTFLD